MSSKPKNIRYVSPKGRAIWPRLNAPDTKYKPEGEFSARLGMQQDDPETQAFLKKLEGIRDDAWAKFVSENPKKKKATMAPFYREETDDEGDETGEISFNFKMKHKIKVKATGKEFTLVPTILNAKKVILKNPPNIGSGSVLKVSFEIAPYFNEKDKEFGLSLRLIAVQIITLVEFGGAGRAANDFDEEDGDEVNDGEAGDDSDDDDDDSDDSDDSDSDDGDY